MKTVMGVVNPPRVWKAEIDGFLSSRDGVPDSFTEKVGNQVFQEIMTRHILYTFNWAPLDDDPANMTQEEMVVRAFERRVRGIIMMSWLKSVH